MRLPKAEGNHVSTRSAAHKRLLHRKRAVLSRRARAVSLRRQECQWVAPLSKAVRMRVELKAAMIITTRTTVAAWLAIPLRFAAVARAVPFTATDRCRS